MTTWGTYDDSTWSLQQVAFDSFGNVEHASTPLMVGGSELPVIWAGHQFDEALGLYHMQARWYDPTNGRFISPDPIGFAAGDANLHRYVSNSSPNAIDPAGHEDFPLFQWNGHTQTAIITATGTTSGDTRAADALLKRVSRDFPGASALDATWHHASFDRASGTFVMELIENEAHAAQAHIGGFAQYLDWVADVLRGGERSIAGLNDNMATTLIRTLKNEDLGKRVSGRLKNNAIDYAVKRLRNGGIRISFTDGGEVIVACLKFRYQAL